MGNKKFKKGKRGGFFRTAGQGVQALWALIWKLLPLALVLCLAGYAGYEIKKILVKDRFLQVQEIKVVPPEVLSSQSVRALESKILGKNILTLDLKKIESQIELGPGAQSVRVIRQMPATIRVEIKKRNPIANVRLKPNGAYAIVADDGYVIDAKPEADPAWIIIENYSEPVKEPRVGVRIQNKGFPEALRFLEVYRRHELSRRETLTRIFLDPYGNITIRLGQGPDFQLGRKASERLSFLTKALFLFNTEPRENIEYIDLQYDRIAVKRKQG